MNKSGVILFGHGARDPRWAEPFEAVASTLRGQQPALEVRTAFLEFMSPTLQEAGTALAALGCTHVTVLPMFLGTGGHVRQDLPERLQALRDTLPAVQWQLAPAIGEHAAVLQAMATAIARWIDEEASGR
jgi:sirohydrochlorin cobaltochelatase